VITRTVQPTNSVDGTPIPTAGPKEGFLTSKDIIKEIMRYINLQKRSDGYYDYVAHYEDQCRIEGDAEVCPFGGENVFPVDNAWVVLAKLSAYDATGDSSYLAEANEDMRVLKDFCKEDPSQCLWVVRQMVSYYKETGDSEVKELLQVFGNQLLATSRQRPMLLEIEARELALLSEIFFDVGYLKEARKRLELAEKNPEESQLVYSNNGTEVYRDSCWYLVASLDMYSASGKESYLQDVRDFLKSSELREKFQEFPDMPSLQPCVESYQQLYDITKKGEYKETSQSIISYILETHWDSQYNKRFYGEGMISNIADSTMNVLTDSAYMVYLLSNEPNFSFVIK